MNPNTGRQQMESISSQDHPKSAKNTDCSKSVKLIESSKEGDEVIKRCDETRTPKLPKKEATAGNLQFMPVVFRLQPLTILSFMKDLNRSKCLKPETRTRANILSSYISKSETEKRTNNGTETWSAARLLRVADNKKDAAHGVCGQQRKLPTVVSSSSWPDPKRRRAHDGSTSNSASPAANK
mmetsp:Transcript_25968/g.46143  ORF Transcript_25968/g.46143 Transcript_25968/m.46143 type:complete len:182 (-) Transcript_25968:178-723(-)|eukprot:CAMPEP_0197517948 /NCGR_PEP_ID=MMETSP1318-20131121/3035_1 /TAXON_ID=552666 /ORGANISM="Partenskyella glossopodia, Strain RCC365" /LENGTH=181 /DNA_ID=CAMNT_0043067907 /DNA_START=186 /DNA_END=731 /DNA_ORIENTATION=+